MVTFEQRYGGSEHMSHSRNREKNIPGHMSHAVIKGRTFLAEEISNTKALKQDATWCVWGAVRRPG